MRSRPVRPNVFLPVVRFGVADSDWFTVLIISCIGYLAPVPLGLTVLYVPLQMWTWLFATAGSIAFFNYIRIGRKPYWLQHKLKALLLDHRQYRAIPNGKKWGFHRSWLIPPDDNGEAVPDASSEMHTGFPMMLLLDENTRTHEACEQWSESLVTTN